MPEDAVIEDKHERWIYHVKSRTKNIRYRVDLLGMGGASQCACPDWNFVAFENINKGLEWGVYPEKDSEKYKDRTCCFHTDQVRRRFMNGLTKRLANKEDNPP